MKIAEILIEGTNPSVKLYYHGTVKQFDRFNSPPARDRHPSKIGIWFSESLQAAHIIAGISHMDDFNGGWPEVIVAELDLHNPKSYQTYADYVAEAEATGVQKLRKLLIKQGYDGIEILKSTTDNGPVRRDVAVFSPDQVRIIQRLDHDPMLGRLHY